MGDSGKGRGGRGKCKGRGRGRGQGGRGRGRACGKADDEHSGDTGPDAEDAKEDANTCRKRGPENELEEAEAGGDHDEAAAANVAKAAAKTKPKANAATSAAKAAHAAAKKAPAMKRPADTGSGDEAANDGDSAGKKQKCGKAFWKKQNLGMDLYGRASPHISCCLIPAQRLNLDFSSVY